MEEICVRVGAWAAGGGVVVGLDFEGGEEGGEAVFGYGTTGVGWGHGEGEVFFCGGWGEGGKKGDGNAKAFGTPYSFTSLASEMMTRKLKSEYGNANV